MERPAATGTSTSMQKLPTTAIYLSILVLILLPCGLGVAVGQVQGSRETGPSGFAVPRFVTLRGDEVNLRRGPGRDHTIVWVYRGYAGLPVKVIAETELWRQIEDHEGVRGWIHRGLLEGKRTGYVMADEVVLSAEASATAPVVARVARGAIGEIERCSPSWCRLSFGRTRGWIERRHLWGLLAGETVD